MLDKKSVGKIVELYAGVKGIYIAELIGIKSKISNIAIVKILACSKYPSQRTVMYYFNNYERWPLDYGSIESFSTMYMELYQKDEVPDYYKKMKEIIDTTFLIENDSDRRIYERHKAHWMGKVGD